MLRTKLVSSQIKAFIEDSIDSYKEISKASALLGEKYSFQLLYVDEGESEVVPAVLPEQKTLFTQWFYADCLASYYNVEVWSDRHFEIIENFLKGYAARGRNMVYTPILTPALNVLPPYYRKPCQLVQVFVDNGKYSFDFSYLDRWIDILDRVGIKYIEMSHFFHQKPYYHIADEPTEKTLDQFLQKKEAIADLLEGYPIMDALSDVSFYDSGAVDTPVPSTSHMKPFLERNIEEAFQDVRAMELCEKYYSHEEVVSAIEEELGEPITFERCAHSEDEMLRVRGKINRMIAQKLA